MELSTECFVLFSML